MTTTISIPLEQLTISVLIVDTQVEILQATALFVVFCSLQLRHECRLS